MDNLSIDTDTGTISLAAEPVKLVIWDLDETFWKGTLSEGGIVPIQENINLVKALSARGIVNSVCSKNDFEPVRAALTELGIWDHFIFPRVAFAPKGAMIAEIIEAVQLRAPSVLFIDDNVMNLHEAQHYAPGVQIAEPHVLADLLGDPRCKGKPDPALERLARYKVLEQKQSDQTASGGDNLEFLRGSQVRISFHHDVMAEFPRIHDLVNRTNQLNFTKRRWPEDETAAREQFKAEFEEVFFSDAGYVKVADRYGNYGICGFYLIRQRRAVHFLFSCRAMNMGVEQFVWNHLQQPAVRVTGEVISRLEGKPDWISVVGDADSPPDDTGPAKPKLCIRGACDMMIMTHYLRAQFEVREEFQFPYQGWGINPVSRLVCAAGAAQTPAAQALLAKTPGIPPRLFESAIVSGSSDIYIISFASEFAPGMYRSRSTGLVLPFAPQPHFPEKDFAKIDYDSFITRVKGKPPISRAEWEFMAAEYEYVGHLNKGLLAADIARQFEMLRGKTVIVFTLNTKFGSNKGLLANFDRINSTVRPLAETYGCHIVNLNDFVRSTDDLASPTDQGAHFKREVYISLAQHVGALCAVHNPTP